MGSSAQAAATTHRTLLSNPDERMARINWPRVTNTAGLWAMPFSSFQARAAVSLQKPNKQTPQGHSALEFQPAVASSQLRTHYVRLFINGGPLCLPDIMQQ